MLNGYTTNTLHIYSFEGDDGLLKMQAILKLFRYGFKTIGDLKVESVLDYSKGLDGLPASDMLQYRLAGGSSVILKPSASGQDSSTSDIEPKLNVYISVRGDSEAQAAAIEARVSDDLESIIYMDDRMGYCCE